HTHRLAARGCQQLLSFELVQVHFSHASIIDEWGAISKTRWTSATQGVANRDRDFSIVIVV
ncbi:hypothetical protein PO002_40025, partial [Cupriavidus necator]|uniref:hypothetical protein n=1 Tax=Cupriavidus necator TaxID=106590 RepID=UPI0039C05C7E